MLLAIEKMGGIVPRVIDPALLAPHKAQIADNCRFDEGGVTPLKNDLSIQSISDSKESIFLYKNGSNKYFFSWDSDVDAVKIPLANDTYNRVFYTEGGVLKVTDKNLFNTSGTDYPTDYRYPCPPAPVTAITASGTPSGSDPTLQETRGYVYTFVNGYGEEGPPSPVSNLLDIYDGNPAALSGMDPAPAALYWVLTKRIYRINQALSGPQYQLVIEIPVAQTTYNDVILNSGLGEVLPSLEWDQPPTGIEGLIELPNQTLAAFFDNVVCFSEPKYPHAWPTKYYKALDKNVIALGNFGMTVIAITEGQPYAIVGDSPSSMAAEKLDIHYAGTSKRGVVNVGGVVAYASPEGIVSVSSKGVSLITDEVLSKNKWQERYPPETIYAHYWENKYVCFYTLGAKRAGFIFDPKTRDLVELNRQSPLYGHYYATAGCVDPDDGTLYLKMESEIKAFAGDTTGSRWFQWLSKKHRMLPWCPGVIKVIAPAYPISVDIIYRRIPATISLTISSEDPVTIPSYGLVDMVEINAFGSSAVSAVYLASTMEELSV